MGCGASSAAKGAVSEPHPLPAPLGSNGCVSGSHAASPNSAKMSGASTPILAASFREPEDGAVESEHEEEEDAAGNAKFHVDEQTSLQDRVNLLDNYVQTQNFGKTVGALAAAIPDGEGDDSEKSDEMDALWDLPAEGTDLDASWRNKIFSFDGTDDPDARLHEVFTDTRWAKEVQIKACKIDSAGVKFLDKVVQDRELRAITLARCNLEDGVAAEIAECLANGTWSSIRTIGLDGNQMLGDVAAEALAQALVTNSTLTELSLWGTGVGDAGAQSFASALRKNSTLQNLWLGECEGITDTGAAFLQDALRENSSLDQLALVMTSVSDGVQDGIEELISSRREQRALAVAGHASTGTDALE